ncbi:transposase [Bradyrhizobium sp. WSM1743]|uniref:transposase n=1 Tax=Bradyrhizobium sp. WSM1743 TaxID=318996 RepID=UPI001FDA3D15|nr:transposase [Bradyrhizobium sp. WSM1743]
MLAEAIGISLRLVQCILEAHQLAPHRIQTFKLSNDPKFAEKLKDVIGIYVDPTAHAVVLSVDEKSQSRPSTAPSRVADEAGPRRNHDPHYKRNGTTTLFAALNVLDGTIIGRNMKRHRHQEFIPSSTRSTHRFPRQKSIHAVVDNNATHHHPKVRQWLTQHPRWTFHGFLAQRRRRLLRQAHQTPPQTRRLSIRWRSQGGHQQLHRRDQRRTETFRLDGSPKSHARRCQTWEQTLESLH